MDSKTIANGIIRAVAILAGIVALGYFLYLIQTVLTYLLMASVIALIGRPVVVFLRRRLKFPGTVAVLTVILLFLGILVGLISLFVPVLVEQGKNLALLDLKSFETNLNQLKEQLEALFGQIPLRFDDVMKADELEQKFIKGLEMSFIPKILNGVVSTLGSLSIGLLSVLFISFFFLKDSHIIQKILLAMLPESKEASVIHSLQKIRTMLSRYFIGLILQILVLFVIYSVTLWLVGVPNALVIAFLCALFNIIPWIGPIIGLVLMVLLTMTSHLGQDWNAVILPDLGWVLLGFGISQLVDNFFSQPVIFSNAIKLQPLEIFLVILISGMLFGIMGMIIAVPGYTALKVILKEFMAEYRIVQRLTRDL